MTILREKMILFDVPGNYGNHHVTTLLNLNIAEMILFGERRDKKLME